MGCARVRSAGPARVGESAARRTDSGDGGRALAYQAQDSQDRLTALRKIDKSGSIIAASNFADDEFFLRIDADWYHLDKAEAYISAGLPAAAMQELENVHKGDATLHQRYLYAYILEAEASIARGWIDLGIVHLENVLNFFSAATSRRHLNRVAHLYEQLSNNSHYRNSPDVARLGVLLLKVQHPELFR